MMFFQYVGIQFFSVLYMVLILVVYYSKKRYLSAENSIFKVLLIYTLIELFVDIGINYTIKYADMFPIFNEVLCKISIMGYQLWTGALMTYVLLLGSKKKYTSLKDLFENSNLFAYGTIVIVLLSLVIIALPFDYIYDTKYNISYVRGLCTTYTYIVVIIYLLVILISTFINRKRIAFSKRIPILTFIITSAIFLPIQRFNNDVPVLIVPFMSFAIMIMYFTLENPDLKLINELNVMKDKALESSDIKNKFIDNISYNTIIPVEGILKVSNELLESDISGIERQKLIEITDNAIRAKEMILNTIDMSKLESNSLEIENINYDLKEMIDSLSKNISILINEKVKYELVFNEELPNVLNGDKDKIAKVLNNILANAAKYTTVGKIIFNIDGVVNGDDLALKFKISDTGCGIKEENKSKIFEKFSSFNSDNKYNGTGLGLAISKEMVELMGGSIELDSTYGAGTTFIIKINQKIVNYDRI